MNKFQICKKSNPDIFLDKHKIAKRNHYHFVLLKFRDIISMYNNK